MKPPAGNCLFSIAILFFSCSCATTQETIQEVVGDAELKQNHADRISWPTAINATNAIEKYKLTGTGMKIAILSEIVDNAHPDLAEAVEIQYNSLLEYGKILAGADGKAVTNQHIGTDDGHGTHIAGIISANCDGKGLRGLACNASLSVYDLGTYGGSAYLPLKGWKHDDFETQFLTAMIAAIDHIVAKNSATIINASFNLEAPYTPLESNEKLSGKALAELIGSAVDDEVDITSFLKSQNFKLPDPGYFPYLERIGLLHDDPVALIIGTAIPLSKEWQLLEQSIGQFQKTGGAFVIGESNNRFEDRSSVLNAMPMVSDKVDSGLWISVAMVRPDPDKKSSYYSPLNSCGKLMASHCVVTPSYDMISAALYRLDLELADVEVIDNMPYVRKSGHSMGVPLVSATIALLSELNERKKLGLKMREIISIIKRSANTKFEGYDPNQHGMGMLDVDEAVSQLLMHRKTSALPTLSKHPT